MSTKELNDINYRLQITNDVPCADPDFKVFCTAPTTAGARDELDERLGSFDDAAERMLSVSSSIPPSAHKQLISYFETHLKRRNYVCSHVAVNQFSLEYSPSVTSSLPEFFTSSIFANRTFNLQ